MTRRLPLADAATGTPLGSLLTVACRRRHGGSFTKRTALNLVLWMTTAVTATTVVLCLVASSVLASPALRQAPENRAFEWRSAGAPAAATHLGADVGPSAAVGLAPAPVDVGSLAFDSRSEVASVLPPSYDLRGFSPPRLTPIGDQGNHGSCWSFASMGSLESVLWSSFPGETSVFSEDNLVLNSGFFADLSADGLYEVGGNSLMATAYLARWGGPVLLEQDAYGDYTTPPGLQVARRVSDVLYIPGRRGPTDNGAIKEAVTEHGAVYVDFFWASAHWRSDTNSYYCPMSLASNHAVDVVGWDDAFSASNFSERPPGDGAFILRNSWGTAWGDDGYFYISYYDATFARSDVEGLDDGTAVFVAAGPSGDYDRNYQYDELGWTSSLGFGGSTTGWFANRFTASTDGVLEAVGFYSAARSSTYSIFVGESLPSLRPAGSGELAMAGYHTVELARSQAVVSGATFVVAIELTTPGYDYPIPVEYAWADFYGYSAAATASAGQSFVSPDGEDWTDLTTASGQASSNVCLKAFAVDAALTDGAPPTTTVSGLVRSWRRRAVTLTFTAEDGDGGSGVSRTEYRVDSTGDTAWARGARITLSAPRDHSGDGIHRVEYRAVDNRGNVEATHSCTVKVDTRKPTTRATRRRTVRRHRRVRLYYRVSDTRPCSGKAKVVIKIKTLRGVTKKTLRLGRRSVNRLHSYRFACNLPRRTYRYYVYATDAAGNRQAKVGSNRLVVR